MVEQPSFVLIRMQSAQGQGKGPVPSHGPVPPGRRMFEVSAEETMRRAEAEGLRPALKLENQAGFFRLAGVSWTR